MIGQLSILEEFRDKDAQSTQTVFLSRALRMGLVVDNCELKENNSITFNLQVVEITDLAPIQAVDSFV